MEIKDKKRMSPDRKIQLALLIITFLTLLLACINLINQKNTDQLLQSISVNTYSPDPYLIANANCYLMEQDLVQKYFGNSIGHAGYIDVFELDVTNTLGTNPWIKVTLPEGLIPLNMTTIPKANIEKSKDEYEKTKDVFSVQWEKEISPAVSTVKFIILYDKKDLDKLENQNRIYSYGIRESGEFRSYLSCYNIKIFKDF